MPNAQKRLVLIVDDNRDAALSTVLLARAFGHEAHCALDAREALALARREVPDVVFIDLGLPDMDGAELARRLRQELPPATRIYALTGHAGADDRERTARAGCNGHVVKPMDPEFLKSLLGAPRAA